MSNPVVDLPPTINMDALPSGEQMLAWHLSNGLRTLAAYCRGFEVALSLFDASMAEIDRLQSEGNEPASLYKEWMYLAGRDAAVTIFHFGKTIHIIRDAIFDRCSTLSARLDRLAFREVIGAFNKDFPRWERIRHAVTHTAEIFLDPDEAPKHFVSATVPIEGVWRGGEGVRRALRNVLIDRRFIHTFKGKPCEYELSQRTLDRLHEIRRRYYGIFSPVAR